MTSIEPRQIEMRKKIMKKLNPFKLYQDLKFEFLALMSVPWVPEVLSRHAFVRCRERPKADQPTGGRQRAAKPRENLW